MQPLLFLSDLHLHASRPQIIELFLRFLKTEAATASAVYILGDLFEFWVGDDSDTYPEVISALRSATQNGTTIYFMRGNRDFLVGKQFAQETGCSILKEPATLQIENQTILLMHGDTLCTDDTEYQSFRRKVRSNKWQANVMSMALPERMDYFQSLREESQKSTRQIPSHIMDVNQQTVEEQMIKANTKLLIHGHTHRQAIHQFTLNNEPAVRIVLGDWYENGNILSLKSLSDFEFKAIDY